MEPGVEVKLRLLDALDWQKSPHELGCARAEGTGQRIMRSAAALLERTAEYDLSPGEALYLHRRYVTG